MLRLIQQILLSQNAELRKFPSSASKPFPFLFRLAASHLQKSQDKVRFIQVGANDGVFGDPLREFIKSFGWEGILVEPQPDVFHHLLDNYDGFSNLVFVNRQFILTLIQ